MKKRIKTVIFDLSEVLLVGLKGFEKSLGEKLKQPNRQVYSFLHNENLNQLFLGKTSEENYFSDIIKNSTWKISVNTLKKMIRSHFEEIQGTRDIISDLNKRNITLTLLSNHTREWIRYCEKTFRYEKLFLRQYYSFNLGLLKPDNQIFSIISNDTKTNLNNMLYIDDVQKNISLARELGIENILFRDASQLQNELRKYQF